MVRIRACIALRWRALVSCDGTFLGHIAGVVLEAVCELFLLLCAMTLRCMMYDKCYGSL